MLLICSYFQHTHSYCYIEGMRFKFREILFFNSKLSYKWFKVIDVPLIKLELTSNFIEQIENNAFGTFHFEDLNELALSNLKIKQLISGTFSGLKSLKNLLMSDMPIKIIEEDLLSPISETIVFLQIHDLNEIYLKNLTGCCAKLNKLTKLIIRKSNVNKIESNSLSQLSAINYLNITHCGLQSIAIDAFDHISQTILTIDLSQNQLTTIDINLFHFVNDKTTLLKVYIDENPWNCNLITCEMLNFLSENLEIFNYIQICSTSSSEETSTELSTTSIFPETTLPNDLNLWILLLIFMGICSLNIIFCCLLYYRK